MFIAIILSVVVLAGTEGIALYPEDTRSTEIAKNFEVSAFVFENESIRLNITWGNILSNDTVDIVDILVENNNAESCLYSYEDIYFAYNNNTIIIPSMNISDPVDTISLGCSYNINITYEQTTLNLLYDVPDCIGNYCVCVTNETNFIKLVRVEYVREDIYRVQYVSYNASLEKGNFYITEIFYVDESGDSTFDVPELRYKKGAFEIRMEYLQDDRNYTIYVTYKDADNINPTCYYTTNLSFTALIPLETINYIILKIISVSLFLSVSAVILCFWRRSKYYLLIVEEMKRCIFPPENVTPAENVTISSFSFPNQQLNMLYTPLELSMYIKADTYEFPRDNIIIKDVIGEGAFGKVYYAKAYNLNGLPGYTMVAVKQLRTDAPKEELADFLAEIKMLKKIGIHKNIVKLLACVTNGEPYMMIMELVSTGDLKEYLLKLREIWRKHKNRRLFFPDDMEEKLIKALEPETNVIRDELPEKDPNKIPDLPPRSPRTPDFISKLLLSEGITTFDVDTQTPLLSDMTGRPDPILDNRELENFALQIATGMEYLEKIPVTHRDLAARNILITKEKVLKISDFGMSRTGPYVNRSLRKVPLRWMAIEAIDEFKTDSKSDVWSFGVVLWEIGTLGAFPYENIPNELLPKELKAGRRLPRPEICTDELYNLMQKCWLENPKLRPSFAELVEHLNLKKKHVYVDFSQINPKYVFPPTDKEYERIM